MEYKARCEQRRKYGGTLLACQEPIPTEETPIEKLESMKRHAPDLQRAFELATEQGNQELAQNARRLLDELPPTGGED